MIVKKKKNEVRCPVPQCSGDIFVKNFQTGCDYAYHVNETKITYVKLIA